MFWITHLRGFKRLPHGGIHDGARRKSRRGQWLRKGESATSEGGAAGMAAVPGSVMGWLL